MDNAFYVTLSKQTSLFRQMGVIANNIANANTTGYKSEKMIFTDFIRDDVGGEEVSFSHDVATIRDMAQGEISLTGSPLDAAIQGEGFFMVSTTQGDRYTRTGSFSVSPSGELTTIDGSLVTDTGGGPIVIPEGATNITIREDGMVQVFVAGSEEEVGRLGVIKFDNPQSLKAEGSGLYSGSGGQPANQEDFKIIQKSLELSNVNSINELTRMIEVSRSVGNTARFVKDLHEMLRKAVETISRQG